jgi:P4 family phage/plasmid primase-like protien
MTTTTNTKALKTELTKLLKHYEAGKGEPFTNTSLGTPKISVNIPEADYACFLELYTKCTRAGIDLHLTEKPKQISPLRVDLDFRFDTTNLQKMKIKEGEAEVEVILHKYTPYQIKDIVNKYFEVLNNNFDIDKENLVACVHEKPYSSVVSDKLKEGVHIVFPHINMSYELQHFIRAEIIKSDILKDMKLINKIDDVVDKAIIDKNNWFLYGSKKPTEKYAYTLSHVYKYDADGLIDEEFSCLTNYVSMFSMRNKEPKQNVLVSNDDVHAFIQKWNEKAAKKSDIKPKNLLSLSCISNEDIQLAKNLVKCLSASRAEVRNDWMDVGWTLYNISEELLDTWDEFSQQGPSYKPGECQNLWYKMKKMNKGMGTLKYWAKLDNPQMYEQVMNDTIIPTLDIAMRSEGTHGDVADVVAKYMKDKIFYDCKVKSWFYVDERNIWKSDAEGAFLPNLFKTSICNLFLQRENYWNGMAISCNDDNQKDMYMARSKTMHTIASKLKDTPYGRNLIPQVKSVMYVDDFVERYLDSNINIIAFNNGVYDLQKCEFRKTEPTDYVSMTTGYDYKEQVDENILEEVKDIIQSMFESEEMYNYVLDIMTSLLYGKNLFQEFYIFTGVGSNGKSMLMNAISQVLGDYAKKIGVNTFTKPSKSANETSELYNCKGTRFIYTEEPDTNDKLITSRVKELSGDSKIKTRGLFAHPIEWTPQFKIVMCCNDLIQLSKVDNGIARRLRVVGFRYKFVDEPDEDKPHEKPIDRTLNNKFEDDDRYKQAFAKLLCDNWKNNVKDKKSLGAPKQVLEESGQYIKECNEVMTWIEDRFEYNTGNEDDKILTKKLHEMFQFETRNKSINITEFGNRLNEMGIFAKKNWKGLMERKCIKEKPQEEPKIEFVADN